MTILTEPVHPGEFLLNEGEGTISRESVTIPTGENLVPGTVLGKITQGTITVGTVTFAGTGNGTCTKASTAYGAGAHNGNYTAVCIEKTTDSGLFEVLRPDGSSDGFALTGSAYDGQVKFTIADGSTDFAQNDKFTIPVTVAVGSGKYKAYDKDNTDGSEVAAGILFAASDATGGDQLAVAIVRNAEVIESLLTGFDETARTQLAATAVIAR
jgi:hypothetical protein